MATIKKRGESYTITVSMGYDLRGKQLRHYMTWTPEPGMTPRQIEKELKRQEVLFEERCQTQQVHGGNIKLADFIEHWLRDYAERELKPRTLVTYRNLIPRINAALGHIRLDKLTPKHLLSFYANLSEDGIRLDTKYEPRNGISFKDLLCEAGMTQADFVRQSGLGRGTVEALVAGKHVSKATAQKASAALFRPLDKLFAPLPSPPLSGCTQRHYHRLLSSMLETAVQWQLIPSNPCSRVKAPRAEYRETAYLDEHQAAQLLAALDGAPMQYRTAVLLLLNTGLRRAELCGLEWRDIDLDTATLCIRKNAVYIPHQGVITDTPKTRASQRVIKLPSSCVPLLRQYRAWQAEERLRLGDQWQDNDLLFTTWNGAPIYPDTLTSWFHDFIRDNNLPKVTLHGLRHTNATLLIAAGTDLRTVSNRLGHAQTSTTANIYAHAIQSADAAAADVLDNIFSPPQHRKEAL